MTGLDFSVVAESWRYLLFEGMAFTLRLTLLATAGGLALGTLLALLRLSPRPWLARLAGAWVDLVRAVPLVLVIFWVYFLAPYGLAWLTGADAPVAVGAFASALATFTLFEACYYCEIIRAGIRAVPAGQVQAALALGLTRRQAMTGVVLPQAFRAMVPALLTQTIVLFQDVSLVYVLSATDFVGAASQVAHRDGRLVEMYLFVALVYFIACFALSRLVRRLQARIGVIR